MITSVFGALWLIQLYIAHDEFFIRRTAESAFFFPDNLKQSADIYSPLTNSIKTQPQSPLLFTIVNIIESIETFLFCLCYTMTIAFLPHSYIEQLNFHKQYNNKHLYRQYKSNTGFDYGNPAIYSNYKLPWVYFLLCL